MKSDWLLLLASSVMLALLAIGQPAGAGHAKDGNADVEKIYGRIQFVESFPDYRVQVVDSFPDLHVQVVDSFPDGSGKWQKVESFPDYRIQLVESFPDFRIQYVKSFPGPAR